MTLDEVDAIASALPRCRRRRSGGRVSWVVDNRVVARQDEPGMLMVRVDFPDRERLLKAHPDTFGVPSRWDRHRKIQADLDGDAAAIAEAIAMAWTFQKDA